MVTPHADFRFCFGNLHGCFISFEAGRLQPLVLGSIIALTFEFDRVITLRK